ncbi:glycine--tRNA ligase subunit beta [Amphibacillus cookii]|uniref:glycine--tRNA ligase subunit beta n=1 Tax=Amphibacillus cookii TaxID=767787 RepID=UPI00195D2127|nr:glycine--tRNA ligase subunit beta [Amphibacillus cookii]MBM7543208.1 glycyl-tRNA synthetase beta chain [Amphibacillus cookii]
MSTSNVLFEIGLEEMPARFIAPTETQLLQKTKDWLVKNRLGYQELNIYATPRRLAVQIIALANKQPDIEDEAKGPAKNIALDESGNWTKAAQGFVKGQGVTVEDIYFKPIKGIDYVHVKKFIKGTSADQILPTFKDVLLSLSFPKNMRWSNRSLKYIRPIKWLVGMNDQSVINFEIEGVRSGKTSYGHRFLAGKFEITNPLDYQKDLEAQYVIASSERRKAEIIDQINRLANQHQWIVDKNEALLEEVTQLVEYPTVFFGKYSEDYLIVPEEALITSMKEHQRYFPVRGENGNLLPYFIGVRNGNDQYLDTVAKGNEKVLNARLADALFFYKEDQKQSIEANNQKLTRMVFQEQLGTIADKVNRVTKIATAIAKQLAFSEKDLAYTERAATICKFDLVTNMVNEFTNLQGIMGEKYARLAGEEEFVAKAINEHYMPRHAKDILPETSIGAVISIADKLDTIIGCISVGLIPTGSQDPYALRRQAMGVIQILQSKNWKLDIESIIRIVIEVYEQSPVDMDDQSVIEAQLMEFIEARMIYLAKEKQISQDMIKAVTHKGIGVIANAFEKAMLLEKKRVDPSFKPTQEALVRVINLAKKAKGTTIDQSLFENQSEHDLFSAFQRTKTDYQVKMLDRVYSEALTLLAVLTPAINAFFEETMVMVENEALKANRLGLLNAIAELVYQFADFSLVEWKQQF